MNRYADFAYIYDSLMKKDINYEHIADYIENIFTLYEVNPDLICDLACGSGNVTIPLAKRGYSMTGLDISPDMLDVAASKSEDLDILWLNQDMTKPDLYGTMDALLCLIDGINYILLPESLIFMFSRIRKCFMNPGAPFIFDISTRYKLSHVLGDNNFIFPGNDIFYTWQNRYTEKFAVSDMWLNFFVKTKNGWRRFDERHTQRGWSIRELTSALKRAGFINIDTYDFLTFDPPKADSQRVLFVCR